MSPNQSNSAFPDEAAILPILVALGNNSKDYVYAKDLAGRYLYANDQVCKIYGTSLGDLVGKDDLADRDRQDRKAEERPAAMLAGTDEGVGARERPRHGAGHHCDRGRCRCRDPRAKVDARPVADKLAAQLDTDKSTVSLWESGETSLNADRLVEVAAALRTTVVGLLGDVSGNQAVLESVSAADEIDPLLLAAWRRLSRRSRVN